MVGKELLNFNACNDNVILSLQLLLYLMEVYVILFQRIYQKYSLNHDTQFKSIEQNVCVLSLIIVLL